MDEGVLDACQTVLGYRFKDTGMLIEALTHSSMKSESRPSNERLEFLGDAILGMIVSEHLFAEFPDLSEGELTKMKSVIVSRSALARGSRRLGLRDFFCMGKGIAARSTVPTSVLANVFEALIAAIYLDGGHEAARRFVLCAVSEEMDAVTNDRHEKNYKSLLQHHCQRDMGLTPSYRVVRESGPDHRKSFQVVAVIGDKEYETGDGGSKKAAEQRAAKATLHALRSGGEQPACDEAPPEDETAT